MDERILTLTEKADTAALFDRPRHPCTQAVLTPDPTLGLPETHLGVAYPNPIDPPPGCTFHPRCPKATDKCKTVVPQPEIIDDRLVECHYPD